MSGVCGSKKYNHLYLIPDNNLPIMAEFIEKQLNDEQLMRSIPEDDKCIIRTWYDQLMFEAHKRKFSKCLEELLTMVRFKYMKKELVHSWIRNIDMNNLEQLDLDKIMESCDRCPIFDIKPE
ncbi:uncharacterized protein LOC115882307 [Sitophilus oryzae]|uniref:Uncharacterized protein LOC115882307 n=1 Tax=Sitophilus oryzae TaxID=7048 RepID=A0A6J2XZQ5_SITOR|nr:uncharacterized protein LOC115882307 [Sitophilus oryzae]